MSVVDDHSHEPNYILKQKPSSSEDHNSLMDFNESSFLNFDHNYTQESFLPLDISCGSSSGYTNWSQHHVDILSPQLIETPGTNQGQKDSLYSGRNKRPYKGDCTQPLKKLSSGANGKVKSKQTTSRNDPQSLAAKNRRERICERMKILQELVPNGTKVDLVTMLEKAISYVKFLQIQVKVLATDEFWPAQAGKAPDISQVKDAIDAILSSSQRERNPNSVTN